MDLLDSVGEAVQPQDDVSARQWLVSQGAGDRMLAIADACHATDFGCSIDDLGLREMIIENQRWDSGDASPWSGDILTSARLAAAGSLELQLTLLWQHLGNLRRLTLLTCCSLSTAPCLALT